MADLVVGQGEEILCDGEGRTERLLGTLGKQESSEGGDSPGKPEQCVLRC